MIYMATIIYVTLQGLSVDLSDEPQLWAARFDLSDELAGSCRLSAWSGPPGYLSASLSPAVSPPWWPTPSHRNQLFARCPSSRQCRISYWIWKFPTNIVVCLQVGRNPGKNNAEWFLAVAILHRVLKILKFTFHNLIIYSTCEYIHGSCIEPFHEPGSESFHESILEPFQEPSSEFLHEPISEPIHEPWSVSYHGPWSKSFHARVGILTF
jgi:hypothetical protein